MLNRNICEVEIADISFVLVNVPLCMGAMNFAANKGIPTTTSLLTYKINTEG